MYFLNTNREDFISSIDFAPEKLKYYSISPKLFNNSTSPELHKKAFNHWHKFWSAEYGSYGSNIKLDPMDFYRQDVYTFLTYEDDIIGTHSLSFYDLGYDLSHHPYLNQMYPEQTLMKIKSLQVETLMTLQFLMLDSKFRYKLTNINLAGVIASLSLKHQLLYEIDATLTAARTEVRAADVALKCGFKQITSEKIVHNVPVVSMLCTDPKVYPGTEEEKTVNHLWANRNSFKQGEYYEIKRAA